MATIKLVYQDCPMCGNRKEWGEKQTAKANAAGLQIEKLSFASPEGSHLCKEAIFAGVTRLPFFTDGKFIYESIDDFVEASGAVIEEKKPAKTRRRTKK
jgi:hypothetical protein